MTGTQHSYSQPKVLALTLASSREAPGEDLSPATCFVRWKSGGGRLTGINGRQYGMVAPAKPTGPLFPLGRVVATPGALEALMRSGESGGNMLRRHSQGDWGDLSAEDRRLNDAAVGQGERVLSSYRTNSGDVIWIITEADRSATTMLLPDEY